MYVCTYVQSRGLHVAIYWRLLVLMAQLAFGIEGKEVCMYVCLSQFCIKSIIPLLHLVLHRNANPRSCNGEVIKFFFCVRVSVY